MAVPRVSIVTATYNRAEVLRLTIESVLSSSFSDWEMLVIGDACTDGTEAVVHSFGDPRLSFVNLPVNAGEQSAPNNEGIRLARAPHVAFLNHDDLWIRDHLSLALAHLEAENADIVSTLTVAIDPDGRRDLVGCCTPAYTPRFPVPASSWLVRREALAAVGPWRRAIDLDMAPSAEWLLRPWQHGLKLVSLRRATVLAVQSGGRSGSYSNRDHIENSIWAARLRDDPALMETLLAEIASRQRDEICGAGWGAQLKRAAKNSVCRAAISAGIHPHSLRQALIYRRKGGFIDSLRATRGLEPLDRVRHAE